VEKEEAAELMECPGMEESAAMVEQDAHGLNVLETIRTIVLDLLVQAAIKAHLALNRHPTSAGARAVARVPLRSESCGKILRRQRTPEYMTSKWSVLTCSTKMTMASTNLESIYLSEISR
jgi:hypothetical protein